MKAIQISSLLIPFLAAGQVAAVINGHCTDPSDGHRPDNGVCVKTSDCTGAGTTIKTGWCPNDPNDVKCCFKAPCYTPGAHSQCMFTDDCSKFGGKTISSKTLLPRKVRSIEPSRR